MALGALAEGTHVTVVPVGMNYFHAHKFRSRAIVEFGDPVQISPDLVSNFKNAKRGDSIGDLLNSITQSLAVVTMTTPDFETMMLVHAARRLYTSKRNHLPLYTVIETNRRLVKGYTQYKTHPRIEELSKSINEYNQQLRLLGLGDRQVEYARFSKLGIVLSLVYRVSRLGVLAIGTLPGLILFSPIFIAARTYSHKKTRVAASSVKIRGNDVMATWKILVAGCLAPLLYTYYVVIITLWTSYNRINGVVPGFVPIWAIILAAYNIFPMVTYASLIFGETGLDIFKSLRPLVLYLSLSSAGTISRLREQRLELSLQVTELVNTLGPDLFPDCDATRLPHPKKLYCDVHPNDSLDDLADTEFFSVAE